MTRRKKPHAGRAGPRPGSAGPASGTERKGSDLGGRVATSPVLWSAFLAIALYMPSYGFGFVWDDHALIESNALLRSWSGLLQLLRSDFWLTQSNSSGLWRPAITLSYWLDGTLFQWSPAALRIMNIVFHAGASALVAALAIQWGAPRWGAALAGMGFAVMPAHVESVAWISGRTDVYCTAFLLLALWLDRRARRAGRAWPGLLPLLCLALALLCKETAVIFLAVIMVAEWIDARFTGESVPSGARATAAWISAYASLTALYLVVHFALVRPPAAPAYLEEAVRQRSAVAALLMPLGYTAFLWPFFPHSPAATLNVPPTVTAPAALAGAAFDLGLAALLIALIWKRARGAVPLTLFCVALLPTVVVNLTHGYMIYGERYFYLSTAGAAWALGLAAIQVTRRKKMAWAFGALAVGLIASSAIQTLRTLPAWASDDALFESMTVVQPGSAMGHLQWARRLVDQGRDDDAERELEKAVKIDPTRPDAFTIRALIHARRGEWSQVVADVDRAMARGLATLEPMLLRVTALLQLDRPEEAGSAVNALRAGRPPNPKVEALWGQCLIAAGKPDEARAALSQGMRTFPRDPDLAYSLGLACVEAHRAPEAIEAFRRAVEIKPDFYDAWLSLAYTSFEAGDRAAGLEALRHAARLPGAADGRARRLQEVIGQ